MQVLKDDQDLINQIRQKDKQVFESLYRKYYKKLYILSFGYVVNHEVAEEIVQDIFINIWNKSDQINIERSLEKYLSRSVINASLNYIASEKNTKEKLDKYSEDKSEFEDEAIEAEQKELLLIRLEKALDQLPPQCRKVMILSRFERLKQKNIAEQMGISVKTVKNHLSYGFNKLRITLKNTTKNPMLFTLCL